MSENFEALIKARLDASDFPDQIKKQIEQNKACEVSLKINTAKIVSDIEVALKGVNFNIDATITPTISSSGVKTAAQKSAAAVSTALNTGISLDSISQKLSKALDASGIDTKLKENILKSIEQDADGATIALSAMTAEFKKTAKEGEQLKKISFTGIDKDGSTVRVINEIDKKTGDVKETVTTVTQKFGDTEKAVEKVNEEFEEMLRLRKQIDSLKISKEHLDVSKNAKEISAIQGIINELESKYKELENQHGNSLTSEQAKKLKALSDAAEKRIKELKKILSGKQQDRSAAEALKTWNQQKKDVEAIKLKVDTGSFDLDIKKINGELSKLKISGVVTTETSQSVEELDALYVKMKNSLEIINDPTKHNEHSSAMKTLIADYSAYENLLSKVQNELRVAAENAKHTVSQLDITSLQNKMENWLTKNSKADKDYGDYIRGLQKALEGISPGAADAAEELKKIDLQFRNIQQSAAAAGKTGKSFFSRIKDMLSGIGLSGLFTMEAAFEKAVELVKDMYQQVYEIDTAMISLQKVTDETDSRYERFLSNSAESAKELGRSISSLVEQTASWAKLGYSLDEAEELAKLSSIYANVAEIDDATAVSDMVTALRGFGQETDEAVHIVDSLNALSNNFAVTASDLGTGLSKAASAMHAAGTDMNKTLAMITGGSEITQSANEFGNFMRTSVMRLRGKFSCLSDVKTSVHMPLKNMWCNNYISQSAMGSVRLRKDL